MSFEFLFEPFEHLDSWIADAFAGAPLVVALVLAVALGLRHASDPDHLVAVTSLVTADGERASAANAARLGAWWGLGHAATLLAIGVPLIVFKSELPAWLETAAERLVGVIIVVLAGRILVKWARGDFRVTTHAHARPSDAGAGEHRHLHRDGAHAHGPPRTPRQAFAIGVVHGLAGTGAIVLLLIAALPSRLEAALALAVFAPMSILSMAALTTAFAWVFTRRHVDPVFRRVVIPALGAFGVAFGLWYAAG